MSRLTPTCLWRVSAPLLVATQEQLGDPIDTYVNGSQVWLRDDGPSEMTFEWRLHPVAGYERPAGLTTDNVFASTVLALADQTEPPTPIESLWDGLEVFPAYGDEIEPMTLVESSRRVLNLVPDAFGLVDHQLIGDLWERSNRTVSIVDLLIDQLAS